MSTSYNFVSAGDGSDRVSCVKNGISVGYYRETMLGDVEAVLQKPFKNSKIFEEVETAKSWLIEESKWA